MGTIVSNFFISLDGVVEAPDEWHMSYFDDDMGAIIGAGLETNKAFLMGRKGYEESAAYWPTSTDEPISSIFNGMTKYVISSTITEPEWSNTTAVGGTVEEVQAVKDAVDGPIFTSGSATTVRWLLANGLVDELRLMLHPVVVGRGQRLFDDGGAGHSLALVESQPLASGVVHLVYRPA
jgi:dihydrofolate reductase